LGPNNDHLGSVNMNHDTTLTGPTKRNHPSQKCDLQPRCESMSFDHQINRAGASDQETGSQDCRRNPKLNHMTLIKESILDPTDFQERRQFWVGESSTKQPTTNNCRVKENGKASKRKILRSVVQTICNSLSDDNILNCNRLFWSTRCPSNNSESVTIWSLAKQIGVTFSGEEEQILKELDHRENKDRNKGNSVIGKNIVDNENH